MGRGLGAAVAATVVLVRWAISRRVSPVRTTYGADRVAEVRSVIGGAIVAAGGRAGTGAGTGMLSTTPWVGRRHRVRRVVRAVRMRLV